MRYPIWKLIPLLGIPGFGCLVLLQVQKDLATGASAQAAEEPAAPPKVQAAAEPAPQPAHGHMAAVPDDLAENPFATAPAGLDFRVEVADQALANAQPEQFVRTAQAEEPQTLPADPSAAELIAADDPFGDIRADFEDEPLPVIQPAGYEKAAAPAAPPATGGAGDFGPDPFGDLGPLAPNPHAAGLEERPEPMQPASPGSLLDGDDPFADPPAQPTEPAPAPVEGETVPIDGGSPAAEPAATEDNPFGSVDPAPAPAAEPEPAAEPQPAPSPIAPAAGDNFNEAEFEDDPFAPLPSEPASPPASESPRPLPSDGGTFDGIGTVTSEDPSGPQRAEITIEKKAPPTANLNEPLIYEIVVTNVGDSPASDVTVSDVIPKGTRLEGTIPQAEMKGQSLVWRLQTLEPGRSSSIRIKVTPIAAGAVGSVATVNFVSEVAARTNIIAPHLSLKVTAPPQVALGQPVDFRFEISNAGSAPAEKVLLRDVLPDGFKHPDGNDLEYEVGTLAPGKSQAVTLRAAAVKPGTFTNTAVITAAGGLKTEAAAEVEVASQALSVTRQGPKRRYVGRDAIFSNVVTNGSNRPVRGAKVVEQIPQGMEFVSATHNGQFDPDKRTVAWQVGPLGPGQKHSLQVVLKPTIEGVQDSAVRVEEAEGGKIDLTSSTTVQGTPSLAPSISGPDGPVAVGERTAFRIRVRNRGTAPAAGVTVALGLPPAVKFLQAQGAESRADISGGAVARLTEPLAPGAEHEILFVLEATTPGTARIRAEVNASHMTQPLVRDEELIVTPPAP